MNQPHKILVSGNTTLDIITICDVPYNASGKRPVAEYKQIPGGQAANVADLLANLGDNVSFVGAIGSDSTGKVITEDFRRAGIEFSHSKFCDAPHHLGFVRVNRSDGERYIDMYKSPDLNCDGINLDKNWIKQFDCIYIDGHEPALALELGRLGQKLGIPVVADLEQIDLNTGPLLEYVDILIAPGKIIQELGQSNDLASAISNIAGRGLPVVVATLGASGCMGLSRTEGAVTIPGVPIKVADTTGAGDAFHGAFVHAMLDGHKFAECLKIANRVAAQKCGFVGPRFPAEITKPVKPVRGASYVRQRWIRDRHIPGN